MPGQLAIDERDDLDGQWTQRRVSKDAGGSERRPYVGLQFGRHQRGSESLSADVRTQNRKAFRIDLDHVVQVAADEPRGMVDCREAQTWHLRQGRGKQRSLYLACEVELVFELFRAEVLQCAGSRDARSHRVSTAPPDLTQASNPPIRYDVVNPCFARNRATRALDPSAGQVQ